MTASKQNQQRTQAQKQEQQKRYEEQFNQVKPKPTLLKNLIWAFVVGGLICTFGQYLHNLFVDMGFTKKEAGGPVSVVLIFLSALLTGLGVYDELGKRAGAGSVVPRG